MKTPTATIIMPAMLIREPNRERLLERLTAVTHAPNSPARTPKPMSNSHNFIERDMRRLLCEYS